jgi:hypothetical protein
MIHTSLGFELFCRATVTRGPPRFQSVRCASLSKRSNAFFAPRSLAFLYQMRAFAMSGRGPNLPNTSKRDGVNILAIRSLISRRIDSTVLNALVA